MAAGNQRNGFFVVHRHAREALADIPGGGERLLEFPVTGVALVAKPLALAPPVSVLFRLPDVLAPAAEAEGLEAHRLQGTVAGEDHQVGPRDLVCRLLLEKPEQPARLVEVRIVGPAVEGRKALG